MKQLFESILDVDDIDRKSKPWLLIREFCSNYNNKSSDKPFDALGQPLEEGDLVLARYVNSQIRMGIIIEIRWGSCCVCYSADPKELKRMELPGGGYRTATRCNEIMKITPEIAEMILSQK